MAQDPFAKASGRGYYRVSSLYFDTPDYGCFWDKEAGVAERKKLRLRYYGESFDAKANVFAEIKRKKDALILKDRISLPPSVCNFRDLDGYLAGLGGETDNKDFLRELRWFRLRNNLRPKVFVAYNRRAFFAKRDRRIRVTIDEDIIAQRQVRLEAALRMPKRVYSQGAVFEVKYENVLPYWFHRILQRFELQRLAFSKYGNSVRFLVPEYNDNNYSPV